jgi:hypothetical protein
VRFKVVLFYPSFFPLFDPRHFEWQDRDFLIHRKDVRGAKDESGFKPWFGLKAPATRNCSSNTNGDETLFFAPFVPLW